jgi:hypothetical protein
MTCQKTPYSTQAQAEAALGRAVLAHKLTGRGGKSWKRLNAYHCAHCNLWHLGRAKGYEASKPQPGPKAPTAGQLRRAAAKATEKAERQKLFQDYHQTLQFCKMLTDRTLAEYAARGIKPRAVQHET